MHKQLIVSVGLIERDSKYLITRRLSPKNPQWHQRWELPGGKIECNETPEEALHREIFEETHLLIDSPCLLGVYTHNWEVSTGIQQTFILLYHCLAKQGEVILEPQENDDFAWQTLEEMIERKDLLDGTIKMIQDLAIREPDLTFS